MFARRFLQSGKVGRAPCAFLSTLEPPSSRMSKADELNLFSSKDNIQVTGYHEKGFFLNTFKTDGALIVLPNLALNWKVNSLKEVSPESLSILNIIWPKPELVILGTGPATAQVPEELRAYFKELGTNFDYMDTANALSTYNFLVQEDRRVVAAMLPLASA